MNQQSFPELTKPPIALGVNNARRRKTKPSPERKIHLIRPSLPILITGLTECGIPLSEDRRLIRWEDWIVNGAEQPGVREALCKICAGCLDKTRMAPYYSWDVDPLRVINRYVYGRLDLRDEANLELRVLVALAEKYNDEFQVMRHFIAERGRRR